MDAPDNAAGTFESCCQPEALTLDLTGIRGLLRSIGIYRRRAHLASLTRFCTEVIPEPKLIFDVGAHVGDRITAFRRNGARVVAVEPQPLLARYLRFRFALDRDVTIVEAGLGADEGQADMRVNRANPTVSTLSGDFVQAADGAQGWEDQHWDDVQQIRLITLDLLIAAHGKPDFIKIDTEGHEAEVMKGLSTAVPMLSFEITTIARDAGLSALAEARRLGYRQYRLTLGESHSWHTEWMDADAMETTIRTLPEDANSGDVVARDVQNAEIPLGTGAG